MFHKHVFTFVYLFISLCYFFCANQSTLDCMQVLLTFSLLDPPDQIFNLRHKTLAPVLLIEPPNPIYFYLNSSECEYWQSSLVCKSFVFCAYNIVRGRSNSPLQ